MTPDLEDVMQAVVSLMQSQLPDVLAAVDAGKPTPLQPTPPAAWLFSEVLNMPVLPALLVDGTDTKTVVDEYGYRQQTYTIVAEAYYLAADVQDANRIMRRYGAAIDAVLRNNQTLSVPNVKAVTDIAQTYHGTQKAQSGLLFQAVTVTCAVTVITD